VLEGGLFYLIEGTFQMTAASGGGMDGTFHSLQQISSAESVIEVTVDHGTGKFENACGVVPGIGFRESNTFTYNLDGVLAYK
jgi:hypothetical protein